MTPISLIDVASYLPETIVDNDFFKRPGEVPKKRAGAMFFAPTTRRHVRPDETAAEMIALASRRLIERLALDPARDIDLLLTNVSVPDQAFTGCGAEVAHRIGCRPRHVTDLHNTGCVSFVYMLELARLLMPATGAKGALLCNVQNAGGRIFGQSETRYKPQAPVPGDGCGVAYLRASDESPILSVVHRCFGENACDMTGSGSGDGRPWWAAGESQLCVNFTEARIASIFRRGNRMVPEIVEAACREAGISTEQIDALVTNQPNPFFLRNWREALQLPVEAHHESFDRYGNLFGAAIPITLDETLRAGKLAPGSRLVLGGFSHAGDYAAAAVVHWKKGQGAALARAS